jgi:Zn-dependent alcohol dehydrogenase
MSMATKFYGWKSAGSRNRDDPRIKLTELITKKYTLEEINEGYADLMDGKNIRGVVVHQH